MKKALFLSIIALTAWPVRAERDGLKRRFSLGFASAGLTASDDAFEGDGGRALFAAYGLTRRLSLELTAALSQLDTEPGGLFRAGHVDVGSLLLGARFSWRVDKRFLPHVQAGLGVHGMEFRETDLAEYQDELAGLRYRYDIDGAGSFYAGAGFTWFMTEKRHWSWGLSFRAFRARAEAKRTIEFLGSSAPSQVDTKEIDFGGSLGALDFTYYF